MSVNVASTQLSRAELQHAVGPEFRIEPREPKVLAIPLVHVPTGLDFRLIPGGQFEMGLTESDLEELSHWIGFTKQFRKFLDTEFASAQPPHAVLVKPFLCSVRVLTHAQLCSLGYSDVRTGAVTRPEALHAARHHGCRLPSEAELEWLARDGQGYGLTLNLGKRWSARLESNKVEFSRFGIRDLFELEWAEDDFHDNYDRAPASSAPRTDGSADGVLRGGLHWLAMQDAEELVSGLSARRIRGSVENRGAVRLARNIELPPGAFVLESS